MQVVDHSDLDGLPAAVVDAISASRAATAAKLETFATYVAEKRDEAVQFRKNSGIEAIWTYCEEAYLGIDDLNRHEWAGQKWALWIKNPSPDGPIRKSQIEEEMRATLYPRITARYVDAGAAKIAEILLPVDGKPFGLRPTPVPALTKALKDERPILVDGVPKMRDAEPNEVPQGDGAQPVPAGAQPPQPAQPAPPQPGAQPGAQPGQAPQPAQKPQVPLTVKDLAKRQIAKAEECAEEASDTIHDWLTECRHSSTMRKAIFDGARLGPMIVKGPVPTRREARMVRTNGDAIELVIESKLAPETVRVSPWNLFPDPACGEDIHRGSYLVELDEINEKALVELKDQKGYIPWQIDKVLAEGPDKRYTSEGSPGRQQKDANVYKLWTFWGSIKVEDLKLSNPDLWRQTKHDIGRRKRVFAVVTLVNDCPIKVAMHPLKSGRFPHKVANWRRREGFWAGQGIAEQMRAPQALMTGALRGMVNNAGKSAGAQIVMDDEAVIPENGSMTITPDKVWKKNPGANINDVRAAFNVFTIPNVTPALMPLVELAFKLAEESTSIPLISQGQSGDTTPDTFGATQIQNNNANQLLRDVGYGIAEDLTEPLVTDFYEWLLLDPSVPNSAKGDLQADVSGMRALVDKAVEDQTIMQMMPLVSNPAFGLDPRRWLREWLRTKRLVPSNFQYSQAEQEQRDSQPPPKPPQVVAAEIRANAQVATAQSRDQLAAQKIAVDTDRDRVAIEAQAARTEMEREKGLAELAIKRELALLNYATQERISLDQVKADLAKTTMTLRAQLDLSGDDGKGPEVAKPAVEPEGRAPDDQAFQR